MSDWQQIKQQHRLIESDDFVADLNKCLPPGKTLLLTSKSFTQRGLSQKVLDSFAPGTGVLWDKIRPNPETHQLQAWAEQLQGHKFENIVALGGGSVIDSAKILCALMSQPDLSLLDLFGSAQPLKTLHIIAIPSTSGTGAEVTPFATAWDSQLGKKYSLLGITADQVILDASLTLSLPPQDTLYPALDALSHALESLWNINRNQRSAAYAKQAIEDICQALPLVLAQGDDFAARQTLQRAATLAGLAICQTRTAIAHAISYPLTASYGVPHGLACSFTLAAIIQDVGAENLNLPAKLVDKVLKLLSSLELASQITNYASIEVIIAQSTLDLEPSRLGNFSLQTTAEMIQAMLERSISDTGKT